MKLGIGWRQEGFLFQYFRNEDSMNSRWAKEKAGVQIRQPKRVWNYFCIADMSKQAQAGQRNNAGPAFRPVRAN